MSVDMDRILSSDPVLAEIAELFAQPAPSSSRRPTTRPRRTTTGPQSTRLVTRPGPPRRVLLGAIALVVLLAALTSAGSVLGSVVAAGVGIMIAIAVATWFLGKPFRTTANAMKRDQGLRRSRSL